MAGSDEDCGSSRKPGAEDRGWSSTGQVLGDLMSYPILRPNRVPIVCVPRNQVYTYTVQKIDTE
jgi:hypothetical protein